MDIQFPKFVGRDTQLSNIKAQIARQGQTVVVNIAGAGGVGKTTLLRKVKQDLKSSDTLITEIIDFSHTVHRVQSWILEQITAIRPKAFPIYREKTRDIEKLEPLSRLYREREALDALVLDYNHFAQDHRIVLLFDTVELIQETPLLAFVLELVARLENTVLILAGRYNDDSSTVARLKASFGAEQVLTFRLGGFTKDEAELYFDEAVTPGLREVHTGLLENIYLLSEGNAIKIALALDWLSRGIPIMPEVTQWKPEDLVVLKKESPSEFDARRTRFEKALMVGISRLEDPLYEVILYMAHFNKRFNHQMLMFFFPKETDKVFSRLIDLPFVKYVNKEYFVLHDEMTRLAQEYIWDSIEDPDRTQRRELSHAACEYYQQELSALPPMDERTEQDRITSWSYAVECMYYRLYANFQEGYPRFEELFEELTDDQRPGLAALAVNFLREFEDEREFSDLLKCFVDGYYDGGVLLSQQQLKEAQETLARGLEQLNLTLHRLDLRQASALDRHLINRRHEVYHQLGFCYRSMGDWNKAILNYEKSLEIALELSRELDEKSPLKTRLMGQIAETLNSLSNVHRLVGNFHQARLLCKTSILLRHTWDQKQETKSQYVMAMILWEMGGTAESMRYLRAAENSCPPEDESTQALTTKHRAYILYRAGLPDLAIPLLAEAESVFRRRGQFSELADTLNMRSRIYREHPEIVREQSTDRDHMVEAEKQTKAAYEIAERIGDEFRLSECHLTQAILYYRWSQQPSVEQARRQECYNRALEHYERGLELAEDRFYRLLSVYSGLRGDMAFNERDYDLAFEHYNQQCELATRFKRAVYERVIDSIGDRLRELGSTDPGLARLYIDRALKFWRWEKQLADDYPELIDEVLEIKRQIDEGEELEWLDWQYQQAMLKGEWEKASTSCDRILEIPSLYDDINRAEVILDKVQATHRWGDLSGARRLSKVVLQIGTKLKAPALVGNAHLMLARVLWDATNTAEAAAQLNQAEQAFTESQDELGLARVKRLRAYIRHRTGFFHAPEDTSQKVAGDFLYPMDELKQAALVFEKHQLDSELADAWNVMSRILRTAPSKPDYAQAGEYAQRALQRAEAVKDSYRIAECNLSLTILAYRLAQEDEQEELYDQALKYCDAGFAVLSRETHLLRSVYQGLRGSILLEKGSESQDPPNRVAYWDQAFDAFARELVEAASSKPARLVRALDLIHDALMRLPAEHVTTYTQRIRSAWPEDRFKQEFSILEDMCEQAVQYRPYV